MVRSVADQFPIDRPAPLRATDRASVSHALAQQLPGTRHRNFRRDRSAKDSLVCPKRLLYQLDQQVLCVYLGTVRCNDALDDALALGVDDGSHLHRFDRQQHVSGRHALAFRH